MLLYSKGNCTPQNDIDCYYNYDWKALHVRNIHHSINNFFIEQDKNDHFLTKFINSLEPGGDEMGNKMIRFREMYRRRGESSPYLIDLTKAIDNLDSIGDIARFIGRLHRKNINTLFNLNITVNYQYPDKYHLYFSDLIITFETVDAYNDSSRLDIFRNVLSRVYLYISEKWGYRGEKNIFIENVISFEKGMAQSKMDLSEAVDPKNICHTISYWNLLEKYDRYHFFEILLEDYCEEETKILYVNEKCLQFVSSYLERINEKSYRALKDFIMFCLVKHFGIYTSISEDLLKINFIKIDKKKIFIELFYDTFGYYLQNYYEKTFSNDEIKRRIRDMYEKIREYVKMYFQKTSFFKKNTRKIALEKIDRMRLIVGKLDCEPDFTDFPEVAGTDFYECYTDILSFYHRQNMKLLGESYRPDCISLDNDIYSYIVNAYYDPGLNLIYIPTAMCTNIFFNPSKDPIYNYGSLGSVIGHEMMHCFDFSGSQFDQYGHLHDWWEKSDRGKYEREMRKIKSHYAKKSKKNINITLGENMADICGIKISFYTFIHNYYPDLLDHNFKNLSFQQKKYLQIFFKRWAKTFRSVTNDITSSRMMKLDVHSQDFVRINGPLSHLDAYYPIFNVKIYHKNYLPPYKRCQIINI